LARPNIWRFEGFDAADVSFDRAAVVGQGEPVGIGECGDVAGGGVQLRAAGFELAEPGGLVVGEVIGVAGDPPGYLPDCRRGWREHGRSERGAQRLQVAAR
jgi:hypothetical protein